MRSRLLLLVLAVLAVVLACQQATKPPQPAAPVPVVRSPPPAPTHAPAAVAVPPPEAALEQIRQAFAQEDEGRVEAQLRDLQAQHPKNAELQTLLARLEYGRAIAGRAQPIDKSRVNFDAQHMDAAEQWASQATGMDPESADAWLIRGRVTLARGDPRRSLEMLARAEALDPDSVHLRVYKGEALWAMAAFTRTDAPLSEALVEYGRAIRPPVDSRLEYLALRRMGEIHAALGEHEQAIDHLTRAIAGLEGNDHAFALESRARVNLDAGRVDASMADSRAALERLNFPVAAHTLADALLVKAGQAVRSGNETLAARHLDEFFTLERDPTRHVGKLATNKNTFPAVFALFAAPMREAHWDRMVPNSLPGAAGFLTARDLRALASRGVRFDGGDQLTADLLFRAIAHDNAEAVRELLALGADTSVRRNDGASLLDAARLGTQPARAEIRRLLLASMGRPPGWTDTPVDLPKPGHWYRAERTIGEKEDPKDKQFEAGMVLMAGKQCSTPGRPFTCFTFYTAPEKYYGTIKVPIARPEDFNALREVEAPSP